MPASLLTSALRLRGWWRGLDDSHGAVGWQKRLRSHSPDVCFCHLIDAIHRAEQLPPIVIPRLVYRELKCQAFIVCQAANQVGFCARLDHFQFIIANILGLQTLNLRMDRLRNLFRLVSGHRKRIEREKMRILDAGQTGKSRRICRDFRSEEHTSELQSLTNLVCRLLLEK